jgi:hypothetical protein
MSTRLLPPKVGEGNVGVHYDNRAHAVTGSRPARRVSKPLLSQSSGNMSDSPSSRQHPLGIPSSSSKHLLISGMGNAESLNNLHINSSSSSSSPVHHSQSVESPARALFGVQPTPPSTAAITRPQRSQPQLSPNKSLKDSTAASSGAVPSASSFQSLSRPHDRNDDEAHSTQSLHTRSLKLVGYEDCRFEVGLENLGNTCFMNSSLQCLLHIEPLVQYFLEGHLEHDLNAASPKKGILAKSFQALIHDLVHGKTGTSVAPINFQRAVSLQFLFVTCSVFDGWIRL